MENSLINYMTELNSTLKKIKDNKNINLEKPIFLPILEYLIVNNLISQDEINKFLRNKSQKIRKLKFYSFSDFLNVSDEIEDYLSELTDEISDMLPKNVDLQSIDFLLYEILINIYKHSKFENAYIQVDIKNEGMIDIYIFDDGIGIPGSFKDASFNYKQDSEAIYDAINGKTTDKEKYNLHGRGLNSSARVTTLGFDGEMLIASGNGICFINKKRCTNID